MKISRILYASIALFLIVACNKDKTINIPNLYSGKLKPTLKLKIIGEKRFLLDSATSPKVIYTQLYNSKNKKIDFTFLNAINNSIYFYNYTNSDLIKVINFDSLTNKRSNFSAYFIKNLDSIYLCSTRGLTVFLTNTKKEILNTISLTHEENLKNKNWYLKYPQYNLQTSIPIIETSSELLIPGTFPFPMDSANINRSKFLTHINFKTNQVTNTNIYPRLYYGFNYTWMPPFTDVYLEAIAGNKFVFSFPVSHNLFISDISGAPYKQIYGGSPNAGTISSIPNNGDISRDLLLDHIIKNDEYAAIKYDKFRKVYYRFLRVGIANTRDSVTVNDKPIVVIIMDQNFKYLGETIIGKMKNWYIQNTFVTKEGLNIQFVGDSLDEDNLIFKIFNLEKIK